MKENKNKSFIKKDIRRNVVALTVVLFIAIFIIAIISLLANRNPGLGNVNANGVGRSFMFPFVFVNENNILSIMFEDYTVKEIDDTVENCVHDVMKNKVLYTRDSILYEYSILNNTRVELAENIKYFRLVEDRSAILCVGDDNMLKLFQYSGKRFTPLNKNLIISSEAMETFCLGEKTVLFLDDHNQSNGTAKLKKAEFNGNISTVAESINASGNFYYDNGDDYIAYYDANGILIIAKSDGKVIGEFKGAYVITQTEQNHVVDKTTTILSSSDNIPLNYIVEEYIDEEGYTQKRLIYRKKSSFTTIEEKVGDIIHYSEESDLLIYSVNDKDGKINIYKSQKGKAAEKFLTCTSDCIFLYSQDQNYLYFQNSKGSLKRVNIYDYKYDIENVADNTASLYTYDNKPIVAYTDISQSGLFYIMDDNTIEELNYTGENFLFGRVDYKYLLMRVSPIGKISIDLVNNERITRISSDATSAVYFDREIEYVLFIHDSTLYVWRDGVLTEVGNYENVKAAEMIE